MLILFRNYQRTSSNKINLYSISFKIIIIATFIIILFIFFFAFFTKGGKLIEKNISEDICLLSKENPCFNKINTRNNHYEKNNLINENFFVIDSNNLNDITSHLYGFIISKNGILTDNYYKNLGEYKTPTPQGVYIMLRRVGKEIIINQDFYGSYGIYIYENKDENYFSLSNSFLLLQEYLIGKQNLSLNKDYANHLIVTDFCSYSIDETPINEIKQIPTNAFIIINIEKKSFKIDYIDYEENTISLESKEGLELIDNWVNKWGYILRSLKKQTDNISMDLSGGFDTRTTLAILLNSGVEMNKLNIRSILDDKHEHDIDFKIANNISLKYGFKLNNFNFDNIISYWSLKDTLFYIIYPKLGFHKEFNFKEYFYNKPIFYFTGNGGESIRGSPNSPINLFTEMISFNKIKGHENEFFNSSKKILNRTIFGLKKKRNFNNDFEIASDLYSKTVGKNHFGKSAVENFIANKYVLQPLMDPDIKKIKFDISNVTCHDLIAYIYIRFAHDLIHFPFQGNRLLNLESIRKAERLNNNYKPYQIKLDYNKNFYIDNKRMSSFHSSKENKSVYNYLKELIKSDKYIKIINKLYDNNVLLWANEYSHKINYFPLKQHYGLLAIAITQNNLQLNEKYLKNLSFSRH